MYEANIRKKTRFCHSHHNHQDGQTAAIKANYYGITAFSTLRQDSPRHITQLTRKRKKFKIIDRVFKLYL